MKTILFPSDFSENANNALAYAVDLCRLLEAKLIIFHAYELPYSTHSMSTSLLTLMKQEAGKQLNKCVSSINDSAPELAVETILRQGNVLSILPEVTENAGADMIVMGTKGATGLKEVFVGSNTASAIYRSEVPVMVVPEDASFRAIDNLVYASDFLEKKDSKEVSRLKDFAKSLAAEITVLHIAAEGDDDLNAEHLRENLADVKHSFHVESKESIEEGIREFVEEKGADVLVLMARKYSLFDKLFNPVRLTKLMTYQPNLPMLILHEEKA